MFGGGLFGDLPATSKDTSTTNNTEENSNNNNNDSNNKNNNKASSSEDVNKKRPISLVNALGNAGTTMAFMPTALQRRTKKPTSTGASSIHKTDVAAKVQALLAEKRNKITTTTTTTRIATTLESSSNPSQEEKQPSSQTSESSSHNKENQQQQQQESEEMRLLHASVTNAYDPLHPNDYLAFKEEKKYAIKRVELEKAARDTLERQRIMRDQIAKERKKIEATGDYNKIAESRMNMMSVGGSVGIGGSVVPQEENRGGMGRGRGRGRGRGVSNLPAWLIKKQQEDQQKPQQSSPQVIPNHDNDPTKFQDAPTTTTINPTPKTLTPFKLLVLSNMVAPGETDDELEAEVKEECESTCGSVLSIKVMDADHAQPYVRVFVLFQEYKDANQAEALFQGRSFAGRVITARLVDETTFRP